MIEIDDHDLQRAADLLREFPGAVDRLSKRAVRKSVSGVQRQAVQKISERYTIEKKRIRPTLSVSFRGSSASFSSRGRVSDLSYFKHNPRRVPTRRPAKGRYLYSEVVRGQGGVFHRTNGNESMPIKKNYAPSVPQMLGSPSVRSYMEEHIRNRLSGAVEREVDNFLARYRQ